MESSTKYLEGTLKLKVNREKSRTVSVFAIRNFKYLGFCYGKNGKGIYIRVHEKSWKKAKENLRRLTSRSRCRSIVKAMKRVEIYMRGWLNYYSIADMKKKHRRPEWMAVPKDTDVYLEAVETTQNENEKTNRTGSSQSLCGNNRQ